MIRRSKIKARPVIKKSQAAAAKSKPHQPATVAKEHPVSTTVAKAFPEATPVKNDVTTNNISGDTTPCITDCVDQEKANPAASLQRPLVSTAVYEDVVSTEVEDSMNNRGTVVQAQEVSSHATVTQISQNEDPVLHAKAAVSANNSNVSETKKPPIPGGRRRKITACPMAGKKRRKVDATGISKSDDGKLVSSTDVSLIATDCEAAINKVPCKFVAEPTSTVDSVTCENPPEASNEVLINVGTSTTITEVTSDTRENDSPILGINPCNGGDNTIAISAGEHTHKSGAIVLPASSQVEPIGTVAQQPIIEHPQPQSEQKIPSPKKCIIKVKSKSLTSKYRSKAFEKLNHLKKNQSDGNEWPEMDQNYVSMSDLIYLNPPAKVGHKLGMNIEQQQTSESVIEPSVPSEEDPKTAENVDDKPLPVPQIRIAADGSVVVDEESLVLDTQKPADPKVSTVYESGKDSTINQRSFMRRACARGIRWSVEETNEFYRCLCIVGAEFSLMSAMFRGRNQDDLRRKFRREHKNNPTRVDAALMQQHLSKWTDDMFKGDKSTSEASVLKPPQETVT